MEARTLPVRLSPELYQRLKETAELHGSTMVDLVRRSLESFLPRVAEAEAEVMEKRLRRLRALAEPRPDYVGRSLEGAAPAQVAHRARLEEDLVARILPTLRRYGARRAGVFGSYARGQAGPESDLDLLVELPPGSSLLDLVGLEQALSDDLGLRVEATTYRALHPLLRDRVLQEEIRIL